MNKPYDILILSGPPCSGKSTWAKKEARKNGALIISRDDIRIILFGKNYKQNKQDEEKVTKYFDEWVSKASDNGAKIILDNTFCKTSYIETIHDEYARRRDKTVRIKRFNCSLIKLLWRNFWRGLFTGKKIPIKVIRAMKKNFKNTLNYYNDLVIE